MNCSIGWMDEIWCFGFSKRFAEGYIPYKDFIIIIPPIFVWLGSLFANSLLTFRIFGAILCSSVIFFTYYIYVRNKCNNLATIIVTAFSTCLIFLIPFANYNMLLLLALLICYILADEYFQRFDSKSAFFLGFSLTISLLIKQNIPAALILVLTIVFIHDLVAKKIEAKVFLSYALGGLIPGVIFLAITFMNGTVRLFFDYAFKGLYSFSKTGHMLNGYEFFVFFPLLITISFIIQFIKAQQNKRLCLVTLIFSGCSYLWIYPSMDIYHSTLLLCFQLALLSTIIKNIKFRFLVGRVKPIVITAVAIVMIFWTSAMISFNPDSVRSTIEPYEGILISKSLESKLFEVSNYIIENERKGNDVAIIGGSAYLYILPAGDNNGILDNLLSGNIGTLTKKEIVFQLNEKDIILVNNKNERMSIKVITDYIIENYQKSGEVGDYIIYKKPLVLISCESSVE